MRASRRFSGLLLGVSLGAAVSACNALLDNEAHYYRVAVDSGISSCVHNSDCATERVCLFQICSRACNEDRDCPSGARCLATELGTACVSASIPACSELSCPRGSTCRGGACRNECGTDGASCRADQRCSLDAVCVGTDLVHDPDGVATGTGGGTGAGGRGGGMGGRASGAGASGSGGGTGGTVPDASGDGGSVGSGGLSGNGGVPGDGGTASTGGTAGSGGTPSTGGKAGTGGAPSTGGMPGTGGAPVLPQPTNLPAVFGTCPTLVNGSNDITMSGVATKWTLWMGTPTATGGPIVVYWHGTGSTPSEASGVLSGAVVAEVQAAGGIVAAPVATTGTGTNTGNGAWYTGDLLFADQVVACAIQQRKIDLRHIHVAGFSSGALQAVYQWYLRSGYIASAVSYSGGLVVAKPAIQNVAAVPAALAVHGAKGTDAVGVDFSDASKLWVADVKAKGGFAIECDHGGGHVVPAVLAPQAWQFLKDHPFGVKPEPYTALTGWQSYCAIK